MTFKGCKKFLLTEKKLIMWSKKLIMHGDLEEEAENQPTLPDEEKVTIRTRQVQMKKLSLEL